MAERSNRSVRGLVIRILQAALGLFVNGIGLYLTIQADIGLAPWDVLTMAISSKTGILYGNVSLLIGVSILFLDLLFKEPIGFGMILDTLVVGKTVDLLQWIGIVPSQQSAASGILFFIAGLVLIAVSQWIYMSAGLGCGPRDALLVAIGKRLRKLPIGAVQILMLAAVLLTGLALGGSAGLGTLLSAFGLGPVMQLVFRIVKFEPREVTHENVVQSLRPVFMSAQQSDSDRSA